MTRNKRVHGFLTGDHVRAAVASGQRAGVHEGRVAVRASGSFNIQTPDGTVQGIHHRHCTLLQRADGYAYASTPTPSQERSAHAPRSTPPHPERRGIRGAAD